MNLNIFYRTVVLAFVVGIFLFAVELGGGWELERGDGILTGAIVILPNMVVMNHAARFRKADAIARYNGQPVPYRPSGFGAMVTLMGRLVFVSVATLGVLLLGGTDEARQFVAWLGG